MNPSRLRAVMLAIIGLGVAACAARTAHLDDAPNHSPRGMVAADHPIAAEAGAAMLRAGGNAVDAAVATSLTLSVVRPDACGIGGGGFMVIRLNSDPRHGHATIAINYRETSPAAVGPTTYAEWNDPQASRRGGKAVAVPGTVAGLLHALDRYGTLDRKTVFAPAIHAAEHGFPADEHHVRTAQSLINEFTDPAARDRFSLVWKRHMREGAVAIGDTIRLPEQAEALRLIAERGADAFYKGPIADAIVDSIANAGGVLTLDDLDGYRVHETEPITHSVGRLRVVAMPPPSSGGVAVAQILDLAERLELAVPATGSYSPGTASALAEKLKHAFADRSRYMADPAFHPVPVGEMLAEPALARTAEAVQDALARGTTDTPESYGIAEPIPVDGGTSHIAVIDRHGSAVACTETINLAFGSLVAVDGFGFCLNNQMDDFTTVAGRANAYGLVQSNANLPEPGKRPLSSMSPTIILDQQGEVVAVAGASGGPRIITSTAQVLLRGLRGGATAAEAVAAPRLHHQWLPDRLELEPAQHDRLAGAMHAIGYQTTSRDRIGAVQAIFRNPETGEVNGAADPRKGGAVAAGASQARP
ncbi:MAG: gamma-glutamyltransferase [Planctomycetota bacterium]